MQGQSSPVQDKDPYTGSILMHVGSSFKTHGSVQCTPPKNYQKLIDGSNKKTKQNNVSSLYCVRLGLFLSIYFLTLSLKIGYRQKQEKVI